MNRSSSVFAIAAAFTISFAFPTVGGAHGTDEERACTPDVFRLCSSEIPNVERITVCLSAKKASLSPACRQVFTPASSTKSGRGRIEPIQFESR
jgi:hypothetical protein